MKHPTSFLAKSLLTWAAVCTAAIAQTAPTAPTVTVYSARNEQLLMPLLDRFKQRTGIQVRLHTDKEGALLARLRSEGANTPADILMTVDAGNLWQAAQLGLLREVKSSVLEQSVPANLRDPKNQWFGLSVRARTLVYNRNQVKPADLSTYQDLADPRWKGKLCLRSSSKVYNQSLVAMMIVEDGEPATEKVVKGWVANLATAPFADDTALIKAVAAGQCQVGIVNTYYLGRLLADDAVLPVGLFWANQKDRGVHVNVSGAGVVRASKNVEPAVKLLEFLASSEAQQMYADQNMEYPVLTSVKASSVIKSWGDFKADALNVAEYGENQAAATRLMERAGYK
jgi:iron(III) transport system substrate-binding protein